MAALLIGRSLRPRASNGDLTNFTFPQLPMKKSILLAALASAAFSFPAFATTIQFGASFAGAARQVVLNDATTPVTFGNGTGPGSGGLVLAGVFSSGGSFTYNPALSILANVNNMVSLGGFQPFGFAPSSYSNGTWSMDAGTSLYTLGITSNASLSQVTGKITENTVVGGDADFFNGKQFYLVLFNGTTVSTSTQMGIFNASTTWTFPTNGNGTSDTSVALSTGTGTAVSASGNPNAGSVTSSPNQLVLAPSPEPSSLVALLGGSGLLALIRRRRTE